jgi:HK97 family phage prohead protease
VGNDGTFEGYASVFGVRDSYDDVIEAGAYAITLAAHRSAGTMPAMLWQHDATTPIGVWTEMFEDSKGLFIRGRLALDTVKGAEAYALMKMGALNGLSIGFVSKQWGYDRDTDVRTLTEVELCLVSPASRRPTSPASKPFVKPSSPCGMQDSRPTRPRR